MPAVRVIAALQGKEVFCREKCGVFEGSIIRCSCCSKEFAPSAFEHHSGSSFRRPWKSIKDANGKSIQEYREEQEKDAVEVVDMKTSSAEEPYVVERIVSSRVRQGKKEYLVKWENFDSDQNTWIPPENFDEPNLIEQYEQKTKQQKKRKAELPEPEELIKTPKRSSDTPSKKKQKSQEKRPSPTSPNSDWKDSSPPPAFPSTPSEQVDNKAVLEPLFDESSDLAELNDSPNRTNENENATLDDDDYLLAPFESDDENDVEMPITTITVDYEGMKGIFIRPITTFRNLLDCALEYWEMNQLTSPKEWVFTNEKGAIWPLDENIQVYSPEAVYLKRKPWR